jgi:putative aldouronate transport system permease protein
MRPFQNATSGEKLFAVFNYLLLTLVTILIIIPFWYITIVSLNLGSDTARGGLFLWPRILTLDNYWAVFANREILHYFGYSFARLAVLTPLHILVTGMAAWAISRRSLPGRKFLVVLFMVGMFVNPGLIPTYLTLITYKLINSFWVYVLPWLFSGWELMILVVAIRGIPESLIESAYLDGANEVHIFFKIIIPVTMATIATLALFNAVWAWGDWFTGTFYIRSHEKWTIATYLQMVLQSGASVQAHNAADAAALAQNEVTRKVTETSLRASTLIVTIVPIIFVYPFLQRYFIKGVMIGSIKE